MRKKRKKPLERHTRSLMGPEYYIIFRWNKNNTFLNNGFISTGAENSLKVNYCEEDKLGQATSVDWTTGWNYVRIRVSWRASNVSKWEGYDPTNMWYLPPPTRLRQITRNLFNHPNEDQKNCPESTGLEKLTTQEDGGWQNLTEETTRQRLGMEVTQRTVCRWLVWVKLEWQRWEE